MAKVNIFDASEQKEMEHSLEVDSQTGEIIATSESGRALKFPAGLSKKQFTRLLSEHKEANEGQDVISPEVLAENEKNLEKSQTLLDSFEDSKPTERDVDPER